MYDVFFSCNRWYQTTAEADSFEEAERKAEDFCELDFEEDISSSGDWELEMITDENGNTIEY